MARTRTAGREKAILAAARGLLRRRSVASFTVDDVARAAGISKATFYTYFKGKAALRQALLSGGMAGEQLKEHDNRAVIIEAALSVFAEHGFHATSLEDIARAAGITKGTLYWYFKRKEDLYAALGEHLSPLIGSVPGLVGLIDRPPEEILPLVTQAFMASFENPRTVQIFRLIMREAPGQPETARQFSAVVKPVLDFLIEYLKRQMELGRLRSINPETAARLVIGPMLIFALGRSMNLLLNASLPPPGQYAGEVVDYLLHGLTVAPAAGKEA